MVNYFFDSSALAKKFLLEMESEDIRKIFAQAQFIFISDLTELELTAAIEQAKRTGRINSPQYRQAVRDLERDLSMTHLAKVIIDEQVIHLGKRFIRLHRLRAPDAIQLASAVLTARRTGGALSFVCFDQLLLDAARLERLPCVDVEK